MKADCLLHAALTLGEKVLKRIRYKEENKIIQELTSNRMQKQNLREWKASG